MAELIDVAKNIDKKQNRVCSYRNCNKVISHMRKNSLYCCRRHKEIEYVYRKRESK